MNEVKQEPIKVFISQPMKDKTDDQIKEERARAITSIKKLIKEGGRDENDFEVIESFFEGAPHSAAPAWFLGEGIKLMSKANVIYFVKGWEDARGCQIEKLVAEKYKIGVSIFEN